MKEDTHYALDLSFHRRILIVGDVHGEFTKLDAKLEELGYEAGPDALVFVGDLIDRGQESHRALEWIGRRDVHRVQGNHEVMPGMLLTGEIGRKTARKWGGGWFADMEAQELADLSSVLTQAPIAMTVRTPGGHEIGIVHADCGDDWKEHVRRLEDPQDAGHLQARKLSLWERDTIEGLYKAIEQGSPPRCDVSGIDHVFHGHTPVRRPFTMGNRTWIDTGVCYGDDLTVLDVDAWLAGTSTPTPSPRRGSRQSR